MIHKNITVHGRVQGVWFRAETKKKAISLGITGFVKNQLNGTVYIEAEGPSEHLNTFLLWCRTGPRLANVTKLQENTTELQYFTSFEIR